MLTLNVFLLHLPVYCTIYCTIPYTPIASPGGYIQVLHVWQYSMEYQNFLHNRGTGAQGLTSGRCLVGIQLNGVMMVWSCPFRTGRSTTSIINSFYSTNYRTSFSFLLKYIIWKLDILWTIDMHSINSHVFLQLLSWSFYFNQQNKIPVL